MTSDPPDAGFRMLRGQAVARWRGVQLAFRDSGVDDLPAFEDPAAACLQFHVLQLELDGGGVVSVTTLQRDGGWGLAAGTGGAALDDGPSGIYRTRTVPDLPVGVVTHTHAERDVLGRVHEVELRIDDETLILVAGEAYEQADGSLRLARGDESVLLFRTRADVDAAPWG